MLNRFEGFSRLLLTQDLSQPSCIMSAWLWSKTSLIARSGRSRSSIERAKKCLQSGK